MKHCHFSILWNELPFLKRKLPFLYKHFDQIIFYDLNIKSFTFSYDGSHQYIKNFPDPENKITLIEKRNLREVKDFEGQGFEEKCKMFAVGSSYVRDDMDVFWCTDMDEFFEPSLIKKVEETFKTSKINTIVVPHIIYWWDERFIFATAKGVDTHPFPFARITRHVPGRIYGHCTLHKHTPVTTIRDNYLYHFAFVGNTRMEFKAKIYRQQKWFRDVWSTFNPDVVPTNGNVIGKYHPGLGIGVKRSSYTIPQYIDAKNMVKELQEEPPLPPDALRKK